MLTHIMDIMGDLDILGIDMEAMVDMEGMEVTENLTHMVTKLTIGHHIFTNPGQDLSFMSLFDLHLKQINRYTK